MLFDSPLVARRSLLAAVCLTPLLPLPVWSRNLQPYRARRQLLGTEITITVADDSQPHVAERVGQAFAEMQRLERLMSRFDPASQVSLINRSNGPVTVAPELLAVLQQARVLSARTQGLFNPLLGRFTAQADPQGRPRPGAVARSLLQHTQPSALALDTGKRQVRLRHPAAQPQRSYRQAPRYRHTHRHVVVQQRHDNGNHYGWYKNDRHPGNSRNNSWNNSRNNAWNNRNMSQR